MSFPSLKSSLIAILTVLLSCIAVCVKAQTTPNSGGQYTVIFDGIIMHVFPPADGSDPRLPNPRAVIVQGGGATMRHYPVLVTPPDIDKAALRDATGQAVFCNAQECKVAIRELAIRIGTSARDSSGELIPPSGNVIKDRSFKLLTPRMSCVTNHEGIAASVALDSPQAPIAGFFEITDGTLSACAFRERAFFMDDYDKQGVRFFADRVTLVGRVSTGPAFLHVKSYLTGEWQLIGRVNTSSPLEITIRNHAGQGTVSSRHFVLNNKLVFGKDAFPSVCPETPGNDDDARCKAGPIASPRPPDSDEDKCFPEQKTAEIKPLICPSPAPAMAAMFTGGGNLEAMAGCANTQWP